MTTAGSAIALASVPSNATQAQTPTGQAANRPDPNYQSGRSSHCILKPPPGKPLAAHKSDTGIVTHSAGAGRVLTYLADAAALKGGVLALCAEYGRIEVMDSDDGQVRLQIRCSAVGAGAAKAIEDTKVQAHLNSDHDRLHVAVWHETQGFTPQVQPCLVAIRLQVPLSGPYQLDATADHGCVGVHRLTLANSKLRGRSGSKLKGVKGYLGGHDLHDVVLNGDLDMVTEAPQGFGNTWIHGTLRVAAACKVWAQTEEGNIRLSFAPDPRVGLDVKGSSDAGNVVIGINEAPPVTKARGELRERSKGYETKPIQVALTATSTLSEVSVVAI